MSDLPATARDWAVVIGIDRYPGFTDLKGAENDARAFFDWVTDPDGGGVPPYRARLIVSSQYSDQSAPHEARPRLTEVEEPLNELVALAAEGRASGTDFRVGRRLYLYFAGQGFAPSFNDASLLMANATPEIIYHLSGRPIADWFFRANMFDEVVLFMDCGRERPQRVVSYAPPWVERTLEGLKNRGRWFYAFSMRSSKKSREKPYPPGSGVTRGVFTVALLSGLTGAAYDPSTLRRDAATDRDIADVTASSLRDYLSHRTRDLFDPAELADPELGVIPAVEYVNDPARPFVLATVLVPSYEVIFEIPASAAGEFLDVLSFQDGFWRSVLTFPVSPAGVAVSVRVGLRGGLFFARLREQGRLVPFEVNPYAEVNCVTLRD
jgi:hypothetical protein